MTEAKKDFTLYVGDLDLNVTEQDLNNLFIGLGLRAKHIRLGSTLNIHPESRKFAYISFESREEAERARRDANDSVLYNRHIRVCFINRARSSAANLFIKGLNNVSVRDLEGYFSAHGTITSCKVLYDEYGVTRGYGFLQYERQEDAAAAIKHKHNTTLAGSLITVENFVPRDLREMPHSNNIYVRGFGSETSSERLKARFSQFGEISSAIILPNKGSNGEDRYFGFVCYRSFESADMAVKAMHSLEEGGITWYVAPHLNRHERVIKLTSEFKQKQEYWKQRNLYVIRLHPAIDEEKLYKLFRDFGEISSVKVVKSENIKYDAEGNKYYEQLSSGQGYVCFKRPEDAERAFTQMDHRKVEDREIRVFRWRPRSEMQRLVTSKRHTRFQAYQLYMVPQPQHIKAPGRGGFRGHPIMQPEFLSMQPKSPYQPPYHQPRQPRPHQYREPAAPAPQPEKVQQTPINMVEYNAANLQNKKRLLGENLYPRILKLTNPNVAGKVTGMLLEMKNEELMEMLTLPARLKEKVDEAIEVLKEAWKNRPDQLALLGR
jgi:polyadenylate-binding protein